MEYQIHVRGLVQGVGFRPYVCRLAREMGLAGSVDNDTAGVSIVLQAAPEQESSFMQRLLAELPPVARVDAVEVRVCRETRRLERPFAITPSRDIPESSWIITARRCWRVSSNVSHAITWSMELSNGVICCA